jgi:hypothetical protein
MGEFRLEGFRKMGHWRRIRSRQASKQGSSAVSWLVDGRRRKRCKKIASSCGAIPKQPITNSYKPTARVKKQPSVEGLRD